MKKLKVAVIGTGFVSQVSHIPNLSYNKKVEIVALCDKNKKSLNLVAKKYNIQKTYSNIIDLINKEKKIDLVILSVNREETFKCSKLILNNGLNLFTEKPMAMSSNQAITLIKLSKKKNARYFVGYMRRFDRAINYVKKYLKNKKIENLIIENFNGDSYFNPINYFRLNNKNLKKKSLYHKFLNAHCHDINLIRYLLGEIKKYI